MSTIRTSITKRDGHTHERSGTGGITLTLTTVGEIPTHVQIEFDVTKEEAIAAIGELLSHLEATYGGDFVAQCLKRYAKDSAAAINTEIWRKELHRQRSEQSNRE